MNEKSRFIRNSETEIKRLKEIHRDIVDCISMNLRLCVYHWGEDERHAVAHAKWAVNQASPEKPNVCFDYELVQDLLNLIARVYGELPLEPPDPA